MKKVSLRLALLFLLFSFNKAFSQCQETTITGDFVQSSDIILSGKYTVSGTFRVMPGVQYMFSRIILEIVVSWKLSPIKLL
mgnify:CR=1 FL=1